MVKDFIGNFSLTWGTLKTVAFAAVALVGFILKTKRSKVFVGYTLDPAAKRRLEEIAEAMRVLKRCSQVWMYRVQRGEGKHHWKYNAGDSFRVARLPVAVFSRTIPNVETNLRVNGITYRSQAVYFLPEKILVISGNEVWCVPYQDLEILVDSLEYVESEGHVYTDSEVIDHRWKFINRDGSRDRRFKDNVELPVVRCGILGLDVGRFLFRMMTTNTEAPAIVRRKLGKVKAESEPPRGQPTAGIGEPVSLKESSSMARGGGPIAPPPVLATVLTCPTCQGQIAQLPELAGRIVPCPHCRCLLQLPPSGG
jgi:hypothetical protein